MLPLVLAVPSAVSAQPVLVRFGSHNGFGRVVFEFPQPQSFTTERAGNALIVHFPGGGDIPAGDGATRNISRVTGGEETATVFISPNARLRTMQIGTRVVIDVLNPQAAKPPATRPAIAQAGQGREAAPAHPAEAAPAIAQPPPPAATTSQPAVELHSVPDPVTPSSSVPPSPTPLALAATHVATPSGAKAGSALLPFGPSVAASAFRHGDEAWIVFDDRRPIDLASLAGDLAFDGATVDLLQSATLLRLRLAPGKELRLDHQVEGWSVIVAEGSGPGSVMMPVATPSRLLFTVASTGQVVVVPDATTGRNLLVGTLKASGPGVPVPIRRPEFGVLPSWQGVVVEPVSDRTVLRALPDGYAVETGGSLTPQSGEPVLPDAAILTRTFDFSNEPAATLLRQLQVEVQEQGEAPAQARLTPRKAAAQTMLALGLAAEAQSLLRLAASEDPRAAADPDLNGLGGIAALMSGRPQEASGLDSPALSGSDEVALWRAVRGAMINPASAEAAQTLSTTVGLVLGYPRALRNRLLPLAAETMVLGGASGAADTLLARLPDEPLLVFARALRLEQKGQTDAALTLYDALGNGRDRWASARAITRAIQLRLASKMIGPADAVEALERSFSDWRGDGLERDLRLQVARMQAQLGHWRKAFTILWETGQLFPEDRPIVAASTTSLLGMLLQSPEAAAVAPLDLVTLAEENADAIAATDADGMAQLLADKLMALDLPKRAGPVIERLALAAAPGSGRAALGVRLAEIRRGGGDPAGAAAALAATTAPDLPVALQEQRALEDARIRADLQDVAGAGAILSRLGTAGAGELRAKILSGAGDWHGAALALAAVVAKAFPESGPLGPEQQDLLLRLASAQSRAGDDASLRDLGVKQAARMSGARGDMFRLLTAAPVTAVTDIPRIGQEIAITRALPTSLAALGSR